MSLNCGFFLYFPGTGPFGSIGSLYHWASPVAQLVKNLPVNAGDARDVGLIPGSGIFPGKGNAI